MDHENYSNDEKVSSLNEIINSIGLVSNSNSNLTTEDINSQSESNNQLTLNESNSINENLLKEINQNNLKNLSDSVKLLSNDIDRRIGNYLLNDIEKKNIYISELEELIKFQESEISQLKSKLESINKLDLITKLKSNMESKTELINNTITKLSKQDNLEQGNSEQYNFESVASLKNLTNKSQLEKNKQIQVVQIKTNNESTSKLDSDSSYYTQNQDLVLNANSRNKTKSISKEEEPPRYNGIIVIEKPQKQIVVEQYTDIEDTDKSIEIIKQRRRGARL